MFNKKSKTLKMQLFESFSLLFIFMWAIFVVFVYLYFYSQIHQQVIARQEQTCSTIENALLNEINNSDTLSQNILYSSLIRNSFEQQITLNNNKKTSYDRGMLYMNASECSEILSNIVGMTEDIYQVNLYDLAGNIIGYGQYNGIVTGNFYQSNWLTPTRQLNGHKYISSPHTMKWLNTSNRDSDEVYISLTRTYKDSSFEAIGYVEIIQLCQDFFDKVDDTFLNNPNMSIYIFNSNNECIYPYHVNDTSSSAYKEVLSSLNLSESICTAKMSILNESSIISACMVDNEDLTILISQPENIINQAIGGFTKTFSLLALAFIMLILILSLAVSNKVTRPLLDLGSAIKNISLPSLSIKQEAAAIDSDNRIEEISDLIKVFNNMHATLSHTVNELLFTKSEEINSKILAVQAQMNPHFLYNNLTNISIMAEENMNPQIIRTCQDITFMLRYITVHNSNGVELAHEIEYTERYLNCMKIRYEDDLSIQINIPNSMQNIVVPKLILQPLVENSIKYGLSDTPPWKIMITGNMTGNEWSLTVTDFGKGFSENVLEKLFYEMSKFDETAQIPTLTLDGMGLLNIYIRMKLLYKENAFFQIENHSPALSGASVTLGYKHLKKEGNKNHELFMPDSRR